MAFAMGHHDRLGAESRVLELDTGVVRMVLERLEAGALEADPAESLSPIGVVRRLVLPTVGS